MSLQSDLSATEPGKKCREVGVAFAAAIHVYMLARSPVSDMYEVATYTGTLLLIHTLFFLLSSRPSGSTHSNWNAQLVEQMHLLEKAVRVWYALDKDERKRLFGTVREQIKILRCAAEPIACRVQVKSTSNTQVSHELPRNSDPTDRRNAADAAARGETNNVDFATLRFDYGVCCAVLIEDYMCSDPNTQDEWITYVTAVLFLFDIIAFLTKRQSERVSSRGDTAEVQELLQPLEQEMKRFDDLLLFWYPSAPRERKHILLAACRSHKMLVLNLQRLIAQESFSRTMMTNVSAGYLPLAATSVPTLAPSLRGAPNDGVPSEQEFPFNLTTPWEEKTLLRRERRPDEGKPSPTAVLTFHPRHQEYYSKEDWRKRLVKVARCSSIGEMLRLFIGTEIMPSHTPMEPAKLDAFVSERQLQTSPRAPPLWSCTFTLPMTPGSRYLFSEEVWSDTKDRYVTQTKPYTRKQKSKQIAFFRAAMTLYPDETAHYCTLQRSDLNIAEEAKESPFDFTDCSRPFTEQLTAAFAEEASIEVNWSLKETFSPNGGVLPTRYVVTVTCSTSDVYTYESCDSVVSAFVGAMLETENQKVLDNNTIAMWTEFALLKPPVMNVGREATVYLLDHFFGVKYGKESALEVKCTMEDNMWRAIVKLRYSLASSDTVTVATAVAHSKREAEDLALRSAAARNFPEVFEQITKTDPTKVNAVLMKYSQEIVEMIQS